MLVNYYKSALRSLSRRKQFTLLNTAGLTLGIAAILIADGMRLLIPPGP